MPSKARAGWSYRAARRNAARRPKLSWRTLQRVQLHDGSTYVPPIKEEIARG